MVGGKSLILLNLGIDLRRAAAQLQLWPRGKAGAEPLLASGSGGSLGEGGAHSWEVQGETVQW